MKTVGLLGGLSWVSTEVYYRLVHEGVNERLGGLNFAQCLVYSMNFGELQARGWPNAYDLLLAGCNRLKQGGAVAIALCANTAHLFAYRLQDETGLPIISAIDATALAVKASGMSRIGLLGTKFTMELGFYQELFRQPGLGVLIPEPEANRDYVQHTVKEELGRGLVREETRRAYLDIIRGLADRHAEGIVLGCTEIPLLIGQEHCSLPVFDSTRIHSMAIVDFMLSGMDSRQEIQAAE